MRKIVFDIETRNIFSDVGSNNPADLDISVVCIHDSKDDKYSSYTQEELPALWPIIEKADMLIGFNSEHFDIPLLNKYYQGNLSKKDKVVASDVIKKTYDKPQLLVMSANGFGKKTPLTEYKVQKRGGSGIKTAKVTTKTGEIMTGTVVFNEESELVAISKKSQVIRVDIKEVPSLGRSTQGVRVMKMREGDSIASIICL
jgi:DNA gyrase/topoisomerase IV subunit A